MPLSGRSEGFKQEGDTLCPRDSVGESADKTVEKIEDSVEDYLNLEVMYDGVVVEKDFEYVQDDETKKFLCKQCKYYSTYYGNVKQHYKTKKHTENIEKQQDVIVNKKFICTNCAVNYRTQSGLWKHIKRCKVIATTHIENGRLDRVLDNLEEFLQVVVELNSSLMVLIVSIV